MKCESFRDLQRQDMLYTHNEAGRRRCPLLYCSGTVWATSLSGSNPRVYVDSTPEATLGNCLSIDRALKTAPLHAVARRLWPPEPKQRSKRGSEDGQTCCGETSLPHGPSSVLLIPSGQWTRTSLVCVRLCEKSYDDDDDESRNRNSERPIQFDISASSERVWR